MVYRKCLLYTTLQSIKYLGSSLKLKPLNPVFDTVHGQPCSQFMYLHSVFTSLVVFIIICAGVCPESPDQN